MSFFDVSKGCITDVKYLTRRNISCLRTKIRGKFIDYSCVSKGSSSHDLVISSSSSISIKISLFDSSLDKISSCRWILGYLPGRRNMVSCNRIAKTAEYISLLNIMYFDWLDCCIFEERWITDISWGVLPIVLIAWLDFKAIPSLSSFRYFVIDYLKNLRIYIFLD